MTVIYDLFSALIIVPSFMMLGVVLSIWVFRKKNIKSQYFMLIIGFNAILGCILGVFIFSNVIYRIQFYISTPYVQTALDGYCQNYNIKATDGEFYNDSGFHWKLKSANAECYLVNVGWICNCSD